MAKKISLEEAVEKVKLALAPVKVGDRAVIKRTDDQLKEAVISKIDQHGWIEFKGSQLDRRGASTCIRLVSTVGLRWWPNKKLNEQGVLIDEESTS